MSELILVLNAGSSSLKFALYQPSNLKRHYHGLAEHATPGGSIEIISDIDSERYEARLPREDFQHSALAVLFRWLDQNGLIHSLSAAGHRVVHGGTEFTRPERVNDASLARMEKLEELAPLHLPQNLNAIRILQELMPNLPQVACFDTAFHATQSRIVRTYGLPIGLTRHGYLRYGFHGLSYEYIASRLDSFFDPKIAGGRIIVAHLGNGASLCAMKGGRSVATTLGYSTLDGLIMGTRCGSLDPGLVLQLIRDHEGNADFVEQMLYKESGLLGVSGMSSDMRELLASEDPDSRFAIDLFIYRISREFGSLTAALGGIDGIVFTGGIGARSAVIRARICASLEWLGVALDANLNESRQLRLESETSKIAITALATDEELTIARHTRNLVP